ncbi:MAG: Small subunit (SSU) processome component [Trichoglossum hirsutum]|nr:MAG: Small subunit (SSU) processome component [Trichoglossum hirsutum]
MRNRATTVRWQGGGFSVGGQKESMKGKMLELEKGPMLNGVKDLGKTKVDDARAVVVNGADSEDLHMRLGDEVGSSGESEEEDEDEDEEEEDDEDEDEEEDGGDKPGHDRQVARQEDGDHDMADEPAEEGGEPSFGDLVHAQVSQPIEVETAFADQDICTNSKEALKLIKTRPLEVPDSLSLGTVITQALRTNDVTLLESCLHTTDLSTIRSTIERLDSKLAANLLSKLADRLHRRPGRAGSLMVWVQWTLVSHGGYLASQPDSMKQLRSLSKVISERVNALQPLLALKGKLDMLAAQSQLRRGMQSAAAAAQAREDDDEEGVIYVEGQEEEDDSEDQADVAVQKIAKHSHTRTAKTRKLGKPDRSNSPSDSSNSSSDDDEMHTNANGDHPFSGAETSSSSTDDEDSEIDTSDEDDEEDDDEGVDHDDDDDDDDEGGGNGNEDSEDAVQLPPAKRHAGTRRDGGLFGR